MEHFPPKSKKSTGFRPYYLTFLLFLYTLSGDGGADALKPYGEPCFDRLECHTKWCDLKTKTCDCPDIKLRKGALQIVQYFEETTKKCLSQADNLCTMEPTEELPEIYCAHNSDCLRVSHINLPRNWGVCLCREGFKKDHRFLCEAVQTEEKMAQFWASGLPGEKEDRPQAKMLGDPEKSANANVVAKADKVEKVVNFKAKSSATNAGGLKYGAVIVSLILTFLFMYS